MFLRCQSIPGGINTSLELISRKLISVFALQSIDWNIKFTELENGA
jgi:hypothetical protein